MVVKIFDTKTTPKSGSFHAVKYNYDKIRRFTGELMVARNFGILDGLSKLRPEDYRNYLKAVSARNPNVTKPQFHAMISAKGREHDKFGLTRVAEQWLQLMGYAFQPYLVIFHADTEHNHVHIVSTRIDREGKKINSAFEHVRAQQSLRKVLGLDLSCKTDRDIQNALAYTISTKAQFFMLLERMGYQVKPEGDKLLIGKTGIESSELPVALLEAKLSTPNDNASRRNQVKALFYKYGALYSTNLIKEQIPVPGGRTIPASTYTSPFAKHLRDSLGIELVFHQSGAKPPYGYTIIDHKEKVVFKGSEILSLKSLLALSSNPFIERPDKAYGGYGEAKSYAPYANIAHDNSQDIDPTYEPSIDVNIAPDVDDEAIHGRNRRRKRKARTNSR